jgi:hypothetical protein
MKLPISGKPWFIAHWWNFYPISWEGWAAITAWFIGGAVGLHMLPWALKWPIPYFPLAWALVLYGIGYLTYER